MPHYALRSNFREIIHQSFAYFNQNLILNRFKLSCVGYVFGVAGNGKAPAQNGDSFLAPEYSAPGVASRQAAEP